MHKGSLGSTKETYELLEAQPLELGDVLRGLLSSQELARYSLLTSSACSMRV